jgi:hypothetical protein
MTNLQDSTFAFRPALLRSESPEEFAALLESFNQDIRPRGAVQSMYVFEVANLTWEIFRYRRVKAAVLDKAISQATVNLLRPLLFGPSLNGLAMSDGPVRRLVHERSYSPEAEDRVNGLMEEGGFDERAVETEALRLSLDEVERLDRLIASAESRRDKALRNIALHEKLFAERLQASSDRLLNANDVPSIDASTAELS